MHDIHLLSLRELLQVHLLQIDDELRYNTSTARIKMTDQDVVLIFAN